VRQVLEFETKFPLDLIKRKTLEYFQENEQNFFDAWKVDITGTSQTIRINTNRNIKLFGSRVEISISEGKAGVTIVLVQSRPEFPIIYFDFGKNLLNVRNYQTMIDGIESA
jgi:hypothetical protein